MNVLVLFLKLLGMEYGFSVRAFVLAAFLIAIGALLRSRSNYKLYGKILTVVGIFLLCLNILVVLLLYILNARGFG